MSMQNLAASTNFQLFSKALQESAAQQPVNDGSDQHQNGPPISAADLQQFMLSQLDQQLYLSHLAGLGPGGGVDSASSSALFQPASSGSNSDTATTTASNSSNGHNNTNSGGGCALPCSQQADNNQQQFSSSSCSSDSSADLAQLAQQKLVEQLLEAAAAGNHCGEQHLTGGGNPQQQNNGTNTTGDELSQLMAQLVAAGGGGAGPAELQAQLAQQLGQQQRAELQSPSQQQMSLLDQLQLLQMLGGPPPAAGLLPPGLAELIAAGTAASAFPPTSMGQQEAAMMAQLLKGAGGGGSGSSPSKDKEAYCELCDKQLCNRYFLKTHMYRKHGIGQPPQNEQSSPLKTGNGNFFGQQTQLPIEEPGRAQSASQDGLRDSPGQKMAPKLSMSSTPGMGAGASSSLNDGFSSPEQQQQMALMQQLAAQFGLPGTNNGGPERPALIEQILGSGFPLAELMAAHGGARAGGGGSPPPALQSSRSPDSIGHQSQQQQHFPCGHCPKQFGSQGALFQHQLAEHIDGDGGGAQEAGQQQSLNALAMRWAMGEAAGLGGPQQQQQLLGQLLGPPVGPFPPTNGGPPPPQLMFSPFGTAGGMNPAAGGEMDGAAMLAKLSAELAAVSQQCGTGQHGGLQQNGTATISMMGQAQQTGGTPQLVAKPQQQAQLQQPKRQYSSTSKNFCDLCNKEVCNKYFLRTHMLKMHNIIIDENKPTIANIDTVEKERKGEVKFRCDICLLSMNTRDELRTHKREMHGMQPMAGQGQPTNAAGTPTGTLALATAGGRTTTMVPAAGGGQQQKGMAGAMETTVAGGQPFPCSAASSMGGLEAGGRTAGTDQQTLAAAANDENHQPTAGAEGHNGALPSSVKQLLSQLIGVGGDPLLQQQQQMSVKMEADGGQSSPHQMHHQLLDDSDANNNGTSCCRFCGLCVEGEGNLQLHQLIEHSAQMMLMGTARQQRQEQQPDEDKLVTEVALQMAEANSLKAHRKTSAASSAGGASSSSASASSSGGAIAQRQRESAQQTAQQQHPCPQCRRVYKSAHNLEQHQRTVHHNFVAKLSPSKRLVISPKKIAKLRTAFSCMKCQRRFASKAECDEHVISAHIRPEKLAQEEQQGRLLATSEQHQQPGSPSAKRARVEREEGEYEEEDEEEEEEREEDRQRRLLRDWVRGEEEDGEQAGGGEEMGRLVVDEGAEETGAGADGEREQQRRHKGGQQHNQRQQGEKQQTNAGTGAKEGEKHSHTTSGSTSPLSVQAGVPEGFAQPSGTGDHQQRPFVLQSFTVRPLLSSASSSEHQPHHHHLPDELVAFLPVRTTLSQPIRVTLELHPNPLLDAQVRHL